MSNIHEKCATYNAYKMANVNENSDFINEVVSKDFENGFSSFLPDMNGRKLTLEEEGAFSLGVIQGYKTALNYAVYSFSKKEIKSECFDSYKDLSNFIENSNYDSSGQKIERSFATISCCDLVIDSKFQFFNVNLSVNGTICFKRQKNSSFFLPLDALSMKYPIHVIKMSN